jgi:membrane dipeptidase
MAAERPAPHARSALAAAPTLFAALLLLAAPSARAADPVFPVVDLHVDLPWQIHFKGAPADLTRGHATRTALVAGHVMGVVFPIYIPDGVRKSGPEPGDVEAVFHTIEKLVFSPTLPFSPVAVGDTSRTQIRGWLSIEGAQALAADPSSITAWVARGVRIVGLTHTRDGDLAGSSTGKKRKGLSDKGKKMARAALDAGALLDASHLSDASFADVLALSREAGAPLVATHSNARAVCNHPRNLTDAQLKALGETDGVVGLNLHAPYVSNRPDPSVREVIAQADHLVKFAVEDHVAIGSDFDGGITPPRDLPGPQSFPALARALLAHGWTPARVRKVFSGNALRVLGWTRPEKTR